MAVGRALIADFVSDHPAFLVVPEPYELLDETDASADAPGFLRQLATSRLLLSECPRECEVIAERSPLDFVAYLLALVELGRTSLPADTLAGAANTAERALDQIDLLVVLPLERRELAIGEDEDLALRSEMDRQLLELVDEHATGRNVVEITGSREERRRTLKRAYRGLTDQRGAV